MEGLLVATKKNMCFCGPFGRGKNIVFGGRVAVSVRSVPTFVEMWGIELETLVQEASERVRLGRSLSKLAPGAEALLLQRPPSQTVSRATSAGGAMTQVFVAKSAEQVEMEAEAGFFPC